MGIGSFLGLGGGARSPGTQSTGFNRWEKQGKISFDKAINKSSMPYHNSKKVRDFMEAKLAGKRLSHDRIIKEIKKEFGYDLGKRVEKALTPKQITPVISIKEQKAMEKKAKKREKVNIFEGLRSAERVGSENLTRAQKYVKEKGGMKTDSEVLTSSKGFRDYEAAVGHFAKQNKVQRTEKDTEKNKNSAFQGVGSLANKPSSPPLDTAPKTPSSPIIPLAR